MDEARPLLAQRSNATQSRVGNPGPGVLDLYLFFNIAPSHFLLPLLCTTLLLARARRNVLLVNVCITWIITGLASCLLLYTGNQTGSEPPKMLCTTQASLLYAVPPMVSTSILGLVFQVWNNLVWRPGERTRGVFLSIIIILPYVVYFSFAAVAAMIASRNPLRVDRERRFFYCSINASTFSTIVALFAALLLVITTVLEAWIGITLYRNRQIIKQADPTALDDKKKISGEDLQFAIRVSIFGGYILIGIALSLLSIVAPTSPVPDMVMASMGTAVFLVFGTQPRVWLVWRDVFKSKERQQEETHVATLTPYHLDPLPGAPQPPGGGTPRPEMTQVPPLPPTPAYRPEKSYGPTPRAAPAPRFALMSGAEYAHAGSSAVPVSQSLTIPPPTPSYLAQQTGTTMTMRSPGYTVASQDGYVYPRSAREEKAMLAARYQTPVATPTPAATPRWPVTADSARATMYDHPYRTSTAVAGPPPHRRPTVVRGKQPMRPPSRDTLDSFGSDGDAGHGHSQSFDSQAPLVSVRPVSKFSDDSYSGYATNNSSQDVNSGYATYNSNASSAIPPSAAPMSSADPIEPRSRPNAF
ncbi:hypothetical protein AURDEDRAFT_110618 [Auricularia subglabra TFB-10046 SS5]|nr:hypothetical protein AURDEDRAFT_110618 [Auricularia subglabra TFB-10046 SS5]